MSLPSIRLVSPELTPENTHSRSGDASYFVGQGWYGAGLTFRDVYVRATTSITLTFEAKNANGSLATNTSITLNVGKQWSESNAGFSSNGYTTNLGASYNESVQLVLTGTTDSNGRVSFTLLNLNSDEEAEGVPDTKRSAPPTTNKRFSQIIPLFTGSNYPSAALDLIAFHIVPSSSSVAYDLFSKTYIDTPFSGTFSNIRVPRQWLEGVPIRGTLIPPSGGTIAVGTRVAIYDAYIDNQNRLRYYGPKLLAGGSTTANVDASGNFTMEGWRTQIPTDKENVALIAFLPDVAVPLFDDAILTAPTIYPIRRAPGNATVTVTGPGVGYTTPITGSVSLVSTGYKAVAYVLTYFSGMYHAYGPKAEAPIQSDGSFSIANWVTEFVSDGPGASSYDDAFVSRFLVYLMPEGVTAPYVNDTTVASVEEAATAWGNVERAPLTPEAYAAYKLVHTDASARITILARSLTASDTSIAAGAIVALLCEHSDAAKTEYINNQPDEVINNEESVSTDLRELDAPSTTLIMSTCTAYYNPDHPPTASYICAPSSISSTDITISHPDILINNALAAIVMLSNINYTVTVDGVPITMLVDSNNVVYINGSPIIMVFGLLLPHVIISGNKRIIMRLYSVGLNGTSFEVEEITPPSNNLPCFPAGTKLLTTAGFKAVEDLMSKDAIITADGRSVAPKLYSQTIESATEKTAPYYIRAGAFGVSSPCADIKLSPLHAIQSKKGVWQIPQYAAEMFDGITQYGVGEKVTYYHVELPNYFTDNIVLEGGVVVESFGAKQTAGMTTSVYKWSNSLKGFTRAGPSKAIIARK